MTIGTVSSHFEKKSVRASYKKHRIVFNETEVGLEECMQKLSSQRRDLCQYLFSHSPKSIFVH